MRFQHRGHDISSSGGRSYHRAGVSPYALLSPLRSCQSCRKPPFPSARAWAWSVFLFRFSSAGARCLKSLDLRNGAAHRSEEHTSELQSLMRISYAVFCLKKKNTNVTKLNKNNITLEHLT